MKQKIPIAITHLPPCTPFEEAAECAIDDLGLRRGIIEYRKVLEQEGVEVFTRHRNMLSTNKGFYFAFYEDDLKVVEDEQKVKPFMGEDGRLKVVLMNDKNMPEVKDLATLVAETFVPNPNGYTKVGFKNNNVEDCNSENLTWHE